MLDLHQHTVCSLQVCLFYSIHQAPPTKLTLKNRKIESKAHAPRSNTLPGKILENECHINTLYSYKFELEFWVYFDSDIRLSNNCADQSKEP